MHCTLISTAIGVSIEHQHLLDRNG
jgi:hypothetical protein